MTTIAASKTQIACDLQATGIYKFKLATKIRKFSSHLATYPHADFYAGFAGTVTDCLPVFEWLENPDEVKRPKKTNAEFLILTEDKKIFCIQHNPNPATWLEMGNHGAIGSGQAFAMAAMASGKSPVEACKIAGKLDPNTGMGYKYYNL